MIQIPTRHRDTSKAEEEELRGVVEHVGSGQRQPFADTRELLAFLGADHRGLPKGVEQ